MHTSYFACGCFWGAQFLFQQLPGVVGTSVGYMGGNAPSPTYQQVCSGNTRYKEVVKVIYDTRKISYGDLVMLFFEIHDFEQINGQGPDIGDQYLSVLFTTSDEEQLQALEILQKLKALGFHPATTIQTASKFWPAEEYHENYYQKTGHKPYCHVRRKIFS